MVTDAPERSCRVRHFGHEAADPKQCRYSSTPMRELRTACTVAMMKVGEAEQIQRPDQRPKEENYKPVSMRRDRSWRVIGKVLWWIRQAAAPTRLQRYGYRGWVKKKKKATNSAPFPLKTTINFKGPGQDTV
jgi:hypothetical protein